MKWRVRFGELFSTMKALRIKSVGAASHTRAQPISRTHITFSNEPSDTDDIQWVYFSHFPMPKTAVIELPGMFVHW